MNEQELNPKKTESQDLAASADNGENPLSMLKIKVETVSGVTGAGIIFGDEPSSAEGS
jgi:hypothetical protein